MDPNIMEAIRLAYEVAKREHATKEKTLDNYIGTARRLEKRRADEIQRKLKRVTPEEKILNAHALLARAHDAYETTGKRLKELAKVLEPEKVEEKISFPGMLEGTPEEEEEIPGTPVPVPENQKPEIPTPGAKVSVSGWGSSGSPKAAFPGMIKLEAPEGVLKDTQHKNTHVGDLKSDMCHFEFTPMRGCMLQGEGWHAGKPCLLAVNAHGCIKHLGCTDCGEPHLYEKASRYTKDENGNRCRTSFFSPGTVCNETCGELADRFVTVHSAFRLGAFGCKKVMTPAPAQPPTMGIRAKQDRLILLRHASKCPAAPGTCKIAGTCDAAKTLWTHLEKCKSEECLVPHCVASRQLLGHYHKCNYIQCDVCQPVKNAIDKQHKTREPKMLHEDGKNHTETRRQFMERITTILRQRKPEAAEKWLISLPMVVQRIEAKLFKRAPTLEAYLAVSTLEARMDTAAEEIKREITTDWTAPAVRPIQGPAPRPIIPEMPHSLPALQVPQVPTPSPSVPEKDCVVTCAFRDKPDEIFIIEGGPKLKPIEKLEGKWVIKYTSSLGDGQIEMPPGTIKVTPTWV